MQYYNFYDSEIEENEQEYIFKFGKHKGKSLYFLFSNDEKYLYYITHQTWFKDKKIIKDFLSKKIRIKIKLEVHSQYTHAAIVFVMLRSSPKVS